MQCLNIYRRDFKINALWLRNRGRNMYHFVWEEKVWTPRSVRSRMCPCALQPIKYGLLITRAPHNHVKYSTATRHSWHLLCTRCQFFSLNKEEAKTNNSSGGGCVVVGVEEIFTCQPRPQLSSLHNQRKMAIITIRQLSAWFVLKTEARLAI